MTKINKKRLGFGHIFFNEECQKIRNEGLPEKKVFPDKKFVLGSIVTGQNLNENPVLRENLFH